MVGGRSRRRGRAQSGLLPLRRGGVSSTVSWWYCDLKIFYFNDFLFSLGHQYARFLKAWFSLGAVFTSVALAGVSLMVLKNTVDTLRLFKETVGLNDFSLSWLFGTSSLLSGLSMSVMDTGILIASTFVSIGVHEFGHAVAAASEGLRIEYLALFVAFLFPGALVAFDNDWLRSLPHFAILRIHSAGIWHNIVFCAACMLTIVSLPLLLHPLYIHNEGPLVLNVPEGSIMSGYLSPADIITAVDGSHVKHPFDWVNNLAEKKSQALDSSNIEDAPKSQSPIMKKGYCVPNSLIRETETSEATSDKVSCPNELAAFVSMRCSNSDFLSRNVVDENLLEDEHCLVPKEVVKLKKCGTGWNMNKTGAITCSCNQEETCMIPVQRPDFSWVEITYSSPFSSRCSQQMKNTSLDYLSSEFGSTYCGGTFIYIGDVRYVAQSVQLSAYRPRWEYTAFLAYAPYILEKVLSLSFLASASLALFNSLPVYYLDGQSILESILFLITCLPRKRRMIILQTTAFPLFVAQIFFMLTSGLCVIHSRYLLECIRNHSRLLYD